MNTTRNEASVEVYTPRDENEVVVLAFWASDDLSFELRAPYDAVDDYIVTSAAGTAGQGALVSCDIDGTTLSVEFTADAADELALPRSMVLDLTATEEEVASAGTWIHEMLHGYGTAKTA